VLSSAALTSFANAQTDIYDEITADTIWSIAGSPYVLSSHVIVGENVTLTIEPGVTVDLAGFYLQVEGTLNAVGNSSNPIKFESQPANAEIIFESSSTPFNADDNSGCIIENAEINAEISINGSAPIISKCQIKGGITITQAAPTITHNNLSEGNATYAINIQQESAPTITSNTITGKTVGISFNLLNNGYTDNAYNANVENNAIIDCETGIGIGEGEGTILVYGNLIYGSNVAIRNVNSSATVNVEFNLIMNNTYGIDVGAQLNIQENTIYNNTVGIYYQTVAQSLICYNNIMNNTLYNFETTTSTDLEAVYNYWGTQDIPTINQTIYDKNNNESLGTIQYLPALDSPYADAPIIPNVNMNPTTTPTPTNTPIQTPTQTLQPTPTKTATPTPTQVTQGSFGVIEIGIIALLSIVIAITLIIAYKKGGKKHSPSESKTIQ
jgi:hypothetical protein